jgi:hypothetical protein
MVELEYVLQGTPKEITEQLLLRHADEVYYNPESLSLNEKKVIEDCLVFHKKNPIVWKTFYNLAYQVFTKQKRFGVAAIWERMRWDLHFTLNSDLAYKLNNDYKAFYSRLFNEVIQADFFTMRGSLFDEVFFEILAEEAKCL